MSLPRLPSVREIIKLYGLTAKSQLSQNFILDKNITDKIVRCALLSENTPLVLEVGPGVRNLVVVEKDDRFLPTLNQLSEASENRLNVIHGSILGLSHQTILNKAGMNNITATTSQSIANPLHIMGNLPFNIATPLLIQWLHLLSVRKGIFGVSSQSAWMTLMFQKEVGDRIIAKESTKNRGRLAIMAQSLCDVKEVYHVPASVFVPKPKVDASVVQLIPKDNIFKHQEGAYVTLENLLRYYFTKRRKTVGHITRRLAKDASLSEEVVAGIETLIDFKARPEDIATDNYCQVAKHLYQQNIIDLPQ
ncbi:unnamed protein product [Cunninghamella blakesleeana]